MAAAGGGGGLTTREALGRLHDDIAAALEHHHKEEALSRKRGCWGSRGVLYEALHHNCQLSLFHWSSALALLLAAGALMAAYASASHDRFQWVPVEVVVLVVAVGANVYLGWWDTALRHQELPHLTQRTLSKLRDG
ncbi:uncharacterized protein LOC127006416 [Eriocheir sinensis]|uniref:uncharacterized protein LOC127006416 n=1 Tax=Eriocheir sinensis TaxID=95602 RepID=UPI0021C84A14|nr:uncharacterized protein LOC127006416 [Eriocheir sinensis]